MNDGNTILRVGAITATGRQTLNLPAAAVTERLAFLGRVGSGKTYAAMKMAEEMARIGAQFVVLDPVGVWWGLRLAADGHSKGIEIPVLGGLHGDVPLESADAAKSGELTADFIASTGTPAILDVSQFETNIAKARFVEHFLARFFFKKKAAPSAVHLFIEEAQEFIPQEPGRDENNMLSAAHRLIKLGRNFGMGVSIISQRPQEVSKKALNLSEVVFAFQMTGLLERKAVEGWIADKDIHGQDIKAELPKIPKWHAHVWSPAWLKISEVVAIGERWTYDASSTPKVGKLSTVITLSDIDLPALRAQMAETIERAKADDPKLLRAEIATLRRERATAPAFDIASVDTARSDGFRDGYETGMKQATRYHLSLVALGAYADELETRAKYVHDMTQIMARDTHHAIVGMDGILREDASVPEGDGGLGPENARLARAAENPRIAAGIQPFRGLKAEGDRLAAQMEARRRSGGVEMNKARQGILDALAWFEAMSIPEPESDAVMFMAGYAGGGHYTRNRHALIEQGLLTLTNGCMKLTEHGRALAKPPDLSRDPAAMLVTIREKLNSAQDRILMALVKAYPRAMSGQAIETAVGLSGGHFTRNRYALIKMGLAEQTGGQWRARDTLFPTGK